MARLAKSHRLTGPDHGLLVKAAFAVGAFRLGLSVLPFQTLLRAVVRSAQPRGDSGQVDLEHRPRGHRHRPDRIAWAVTVVSRYVPAATCLVQAMATQALLGRDGHPACLRIGVARGGDGRLQAHAWVESDGVIVIGGSGPDLERYTPLLVLDGAQS